MTLRVKDIAEALNVSPATVSLVLNNKPGIKKETREKVLSYIAREGYTSKSLTKQAAELNLSILFIVYKKLGKIVSDTPFFSQLIEGIERESRKNGYNLIVSYIDDKKEIPKLVSHRKEDQPKGAILLATEMSREDFRLYDQIGLPLVALDNYAENQNIDAVSIDNVRGSYLATSHLIEMGHTTIGYLCSSVKISNFDERKHGYLKALKHAELPADERFWIPLGPSQEGAYTDMKQALQAGQQLPSAFFADNDMIAMGAMKAMKEAGVKIPDEVSIVGFDDMPFCSMIDPPLTTIRVYKQKMGMLAVRRLIDRMSDGSDDYAKVTLGTKLIIRDSVAPK
jgi:DNA-binding LacI/PurR family transcriptional regulator